ncbi:GPI mannosyltransferase 2 [Gaeumannomyces tritici R3-111a-1]|uniref:GPI mannosyltransferase 2 n=1 Tax=Gaeumannomyces tritici (strain R3-111a-1) TaxID=644352 RepID=J3NGE1_GAET3|nr:GPI mannosyltransferase 2 [Gaeumannomyces tritici R3-111a-1]EJT80331.1 GPI mannosyltransferase 2 [Gaeumannomyces tritici R3-111a-1]
MSGEEKMMPKVSSPTSTVIRLFAAWKGTLLLIALGSAIVGPAYDTSGGLLLADRGGDILDNHSTTAVSAVLTRLVSWDAIYFVESADRGYVFEQEWAFGYGPPTIISWIVKALRASGWSWSGVPAAALVGVLVAHASHLLSALALLRLGNLVWHDQPGVALTATCLHVLSPAGLFLSAPVAEASFSLLSFAGMLLFAKAARAGSVGSVLARDGLTLASAVVFALATTFRSNGLLNGIPFAFAFISEASGFLSHPSAATIWRLAVLGLGGICIAAGLIVPQAVAYQRYCLQPPGTPLRSWCNQTLPSIYSFVQREYWGVGPFRYWTVSNLPLFMLAAPVLFILVKSGWDFLGAPRGIPQTSGKTAQRKEDTAQYADGGLVRSMAAAQVLLSVMALTSYHVQIITRLSSAYPVWYWWLAKHLAGEDGRPTGSAKGFVVFMVMYASIQGVLFSSFLPPA